MNTARTERRANYNADLAATLRKQTGQQRPDEAAEDEVIRHAMLILRRRLATHGHVIDHPDLAKDYLRLNFAQEKSELFAVMMLDSGHHLIECKVLFRGTIDAASVHHRGVVQACLDSNAAAVILVHNHPSGDVEPSLPDMALTKSMIEILGKLDIRVLDHVIVGGARNIDTHSSTVDVYSFVEHKLI